MANFEELHFFMEGMKSDFDNHAETPKTYEKGINGRLYNHRGTISFSSIKGTKKVLENPNIVKYLGFCAFRDELILFVKGMPELVPEELGTIEYQEEIKLKASSISLEIPYSDIEENVDINSNVSEVTISYPVFIPAENPFDFDDNISCKEDILSEIDYSEYYTENIDFSNLNVCNVNLELNNYENNKDFIDVIISITKDNDGNLVDKIIWAGYQNWDINGKIIAQGVFENEYYKRIYYTDYLNVFRTLNLRDPNLQFRKENEFNNFQNGVLLQPLIENISNGGQIRSSTCFYTYRLIAENGQVTGYAAFSKPVKIITEDTAIEFSGGDISEQTDKKVDIKINIPDYQKFNEVECIAIEYEAKNSPTAIRSLGVKPASIVTSFTHFGNEEEFASNISISELTKRNNNWKYCSDLVAVKNKLITAGLRGEPMPNELSSISEDFALHSWDELGETHNCLINPKPWQYRYFDPSVTEELYYTKQKVYNSINVFGSFTVELKNTETGESVSFSFTSNSLVYENQTENIYNWLALIKPTVDFQTKFPNLDIQFSTYGKMLFTPINNAIETNMDIYNFSYNTTQVFEDINKDLVFLNVIVNPANFVYGAVSLGFNKGNGIRISFITEDEKLLTKATKSVANDGTILHYKEPSFEKSFMKGEIYRTGLLFFDTSGNELFTIPLGDLMIPKHGEVKRYLDDAGTVIIETDVYKNSKVIGNKLYGEKIKMRAEVRLSCEIQKVVSMYQLVYVERTEENRTVLCQGISAPMERCQTFFHTEYIKMPIQIDNKFGLPYYGGPTYDGQGLKAYDIHGENDDDSGYEKSSRRIITHRAMFYFDSPDLIHELISDEKIKAGNIDTIGRLNSDHTKSAIRQTNGEKYPKFSRKIYNENIDFGNDDYKPKWMNVSVFSNERNGDGRSIPIFKAETLNEGQIISGAAFNIEFDVANNALTLGRQSWFYSNYARKSHKCGGSGARSELFNSSNYSIGMKTVVIKTQEDVFTNDFIDQLPFYPDGEVRLSGGIPAYDTHGLFNITLNNRENVYGGRTEYAYSRNIWIPLSTTIPVLKTTNGSQIFKVEGDTYVTLFIRNKNYCSTLERGEKDMNNSGGCGNKNEEEEYTRAGAWCYAVVLETMVEPKLTYKDVFWKKQNTWSFDGDGEQINEAYFQETSLKSSISRPFRFKDDPNQNNIIAASNPKLNGNFYDDWSIFEPNNFYEIDKDKGTVFNLGKFLDEVYAIQEQQTSQLIIDERTMIPSNNGEIAVKEGTGTVISTHQVVSDYGTSIRRALADIISSGQIKGFSFFDEKRNEFVRIDKPLLINNQLHLSIIEKFVDNPVIDTEGYFDDEFKESNIRLRTKNGENIVLSFNEVFQCFNGWIEYDNDLYIMWNSEVYAPKTTEIEWNETTRPDSSKLFQLNKGEYLNFFEEQKTLKLGVIVNQESGRIKIFKHFGGNINIDYPIKQITTETSMGQTRVVQGTHHRYKIREELHSVPLKNRNDWEDLRGKWMYLEVEIESIDNQKIDIFSFINFVRESYI